MARKKKAVPGKNVAAKKVKIQVDISDDSNKPLSQLLESDSVDPDEDCFLNDETP
jgi:hypothetical protein